MRYLRVRYVLLFCSVCRTFRYTSEKSDRTTERAATQCTGAGSRPTTQPLCFKALECGTMRSTTFRSRAATRANRSGARNRRPPVPPPPTRRPTHDENLGRNAPKRHVRDAALFQATCPRHTNQRQHRRSLCIMSRCSPRWEIPHVVSKQY